MNSPILVLRSAIIVATLLVLAAFWVPIDLTAREQILTANLFVELTPRALVGTVANILSLENRHYILMRHFFQTVWLFLIVFEFAKSLSSQGKTNNDSTLELLALGFLFCFNTVVFTTNGLSEFIDIIPYALVLCAVPFLLPSDGRITIIRCVLATVFLVLAVVSHEKAIFDVAILMVWAVWKYGLRSSAKLALPGVMGCFLFLWLVSNEQNSAGLTVADYVVSTRSASDFLLRESLNLWGIILSGGVLWIIFASAAYRFLKTRASFNLRGLILIAALLILCFVPLVAAHDTIRMVGLIWLPTFLLIRELHLKSFLESIRFRQFAIALCMVQLLLPPLLVYQHGAAPLNCYSRAVIFDSLPPKPQDTDLTPLSLYALEREDISDQIECWPLRPIRGKHRVWPY